MSDFRYDELVQKALVSVVRNVLSDVSSNGLTHGHHFYIRFRTDHPRTVVPQFLKKQHPIEVMIVLQHQFWNLEASVNSFSVELSFSGMREKLTVPFDALTAFVDPSVKFALQFSPRFDVDSHPDDKIDVNSDESDKNLTSDEGSNIISFDSLKKK